jgi:transcriptional regulator with XRE-family HTH domain
MAEPGLGMLERRVEAAYRERKTDQRHGSEPHRLPSPARRPRAHGGARGDRSGARFRVRTACVVVRGAFVRGAVRAAALTLHFLPLPVPRPVLVIREVEQLARRAKWRMADLADALGVSGSMLNRLRAGTHAPSREVLAAILRAFGANDHVRHLVLHFLEHELPRAHADRLDATPPAQEDELARLDGKARDAVRGFVTHFLRRSLTTGRSLRLVARDDRLLRAAVGYVQRALDVHGIAAVVLTPNGRVDRAQHEAALAAPLLVVERVEFASRAVQEIIRARADVRKPLLLTSARAVVDDALAPVRPLLATVTLDASVPEPAPVAA